MVKKGEDILKHAPVLPAASNTDDSGQHCLASDISIRRL